MNIHSSRTRRRTADDRNRREECLLDFVALGLSWRLAVFGRDRTGTYRRLTRQQILNGRFAGGGKRFIREDGTVFTDLSIRKAELLDLCTVSPVVDRRRAAA